LIVGETVENCCSYLIYAIYGFHFRKVAENIIGRGMFDGNGACNEKSGYVSVKQNSQGALPENSIF
jgi:hypothetical protein